MSKKSCPILVYFQNRTGQDFLGIRYNLRVTVGTCSAPLYTRAGLAWTLQYNNIYKIHQSIHIAVQKSWIELALQKYSQR